MKAFLQYSLFGVGYAAIGFERAIDRSYTVKPITSKNILGDPKTVAYVVEFSSITTIPDPVIQLHSNLHFRLYYPHEKKQIKLGYRQLSKFYDGKLDRNKIEYHVLQLRFNIDIEDYDDYTTPTPISEGIFVDEPTIYF